MNASGIQCGLDGADAVYRDPLTGLPSWMFLRSALIEQATRDGASLTLLVVSINRFREINNILGPRTGDEVLQRIAQRLRSGLPEQTLVARMAGDEFGVVFPESGTGLAQQWATRIYGWLLRPFSLNAGDSSLDDLTLDIDVGIGAVTFPDDARDIDELMRKAGIAVQIAKHHHDRVVVYEEDMDRRDADRLLLAGQLRRAIAEDALEVYYQPIVDLQDDKVVGCEALVRWQHPERGAIPAEQIVPVAEQTGLVRLLDYWVLDQAMQQQVRWQGEGVALVVSVNLSARTLDDARLQDSVAESIDRWDLDPACLCMEITESALMRNPETALLRLQALADSGVRFALDDYGTGYSSLAYLKKLPLSALKIDKSFIFDMSADDNDAVIVRSTIELSHNMGLKVVAEGVNDEAAVHMLKALGCDRVQGNLVSVPLPANRLSDWLASRQR